MSSGCTLDYSCLHEFVCFYLHIPVLSWLPASLWLAAACMGLFVCIVRPTAVYNSSRFIHTFTLRPEQRTWFGETWQRRKYTTSKTVHNSMRLKIYQLVDSAVSRGLKNRHILTAESFCWGNWRRMDCWIVFYFVNLVRLTHKWIYILTEVFSSLVFKSIFFKLRFTIPLC